MSITDDQSTFRNVPEEQRSHLYLSGSRKSPKDMFFLSIISGVLKAVHCFIANTVRYIQPSLEHNIQAKYITSCDSAI
jgi:hypothetical protein